MLWVFGVNVIHYGYERRVITKKRRREMQSWRKKWWTSDRRNSIDLRIGLAILRLS
jgi:hypothetical protein